jgi:hypothetical protein
MPPLWQKEEWAGNCGRSPDGTTLKETILRAQAAINHFVGRDLVLK